MMIQDSALLKREGAAAAASAAMEGFRLALPRLHRLHRYYLGGHDVLSRERSEGLPNHRLAHGFPRYIAEVCAGWLLGEGASYSLKGAQKGMKAFQALLTALKAPLVDSKLVSQQSVFGRAVSLCYPLEGGRMGLAALDPRSAFLVYDDTVARKPLYGLLIGQGQDGKSLSLYTDREVISLQEKRGGGYEELGHQPHPFQAVPMVEYWNDEDQRGDFEPVLPLVDAYDLLSSDRLNDRAQFADALLVLTGVMGIGTAEDPTDSRKAAQRLREDRTLALPDSDSKAEWLLKNPLERDIDVLRRALAEDIHKFSMTPDFQDERFAGNLSGVAIKYKLFCLEQKIRLKEQWFLSGLKERAALLCGWLRSRGQEAPDPDRIRISLPRHLPESDLERARTIEALQGLFPKEALRPHAPLTAEHDDTDD